MLNRIQPKEIKPQAKKSSSFFGSLFSYLTPSNLLKATVALLAIQASFPVVAAAPTGRYLPKKDGWTGDFTDADCVSTQPDCKFEVSQKGVDGGVHTFSAVMHCDDASANTVIPNRSLPQQIRDGKFLGQNLCAGTLTDAAVDARTGLVDITQTNLKTNITDSNPTAFTVSQNSFFTKRVEQPKAPECPPPQYCEMTINGVHWGNDLYGAYNGQNSRFECRPK